LSDWDLLFWIHIIADNNVGKKTFLEKFRTSNSFVNETIKTIGVGFSIKDSEIDGQIIRFNVWTMASMEFWNERARNLSLIESHLRNSHGIIIMYDITNAKSLTRLYEWIPLIKHSIPILLVGNKLDLEENREVTSEQVEKFKRDNKIASSMEISLKTGKNVEEMFLKISSMAINISLKELKEEPNQRNRQKLRKIHETFTRDIDRIIWIHNKNLKSKRNLKKLKRLWRKTPFSKTSFFEEYVANQKKLILRLTGCKNKIINAKDIAEVMKVWEKVKVINEELNFLLNYNK